MKRSAGFTLIELMITVVIVTILVAIALPSYQAHMIRAIRSAGQQFLLDIAQRQEQYFLDVRWYASGTATTSTAGSITMSIPDTVAAKYQAPSFTVPVQAANTPASYVVCISPQAGSTVANDGKLCINNSGQRWRSVTTATTYDSSKDCTWENTRCTPAP
jgi:type IV pilus assembly protein PilE